MFKALNFCRNVEQAKKLEFGQRAWAQGCFEPQDLSKSREDLSS